MARRSLIVSGVAVAAASVLGLAACSGGSTERHDAAPPSDAAPSNAAPTQATARIELTAANFVKTISSAPADTSYDASIDITTAGATVTETGSIWVQDGETSYSFSLDAGTGGPIELRRVDGVTYLQMPGVTDGKFAKLDPSDPDNPYASVFGQLDGQIDPVASTADLGDAVVSVTKKGAPSTIDGVSAQPYEVVVDTSKVTGPAAEALDAAGSALPAKLTYTYWIGDDTRIRKLETKVLDMAMTATFTNWGHGTPVDAPSAEQITDASPF